MLNDTIHTALNSPDCAFLVGSFMGQYTAIQNLIILFLIFTVWKILNKLALEPIIDWIKKKWKERK